MPLSVAGSVHEPLFVEVEQSIRYRSQNRRPVGVGQPFGTIPHRPVRQDALGDILSVWIVAGILGDEDAIRILRFPPPGGVLVVAIQ